MKKVLILLVYVLLFRVGISQELLFQDYEVTQDYYAKFINFGREDGLPDNRINAFAQDANGFIWIGTSGGLCRFDGYTFKNYFHSALDSLSLPGNQINALGCDLQGRLWVGTSSGLARYDFKSDRFHQVPMASSASSGAARAGIHGFLVDDDGGMWVLLQNGSIYYKPVKETRFKFIIQVKASRTSYNQNGLVDDGNGTVWIGAMMIEGVVCIEKKTLTTRVLQTLPLTQPARGLATFMPTCAFVKSGAGEVFMSSAHGLFSRLTPSLSLEPTNWGSIYTAVSDSKSQLWLGGYMGGLIRIDRSAKTITRYEVNGDEQFSISHNQILKLFTDREDNIWIATASGLSMLSSTRFKFNHLRHLSGVKNPIPSNRVSAVHYSPDHTLWVGTENDGLFSLKDNVVEHFKYIRDNQKGIGSANVTGITSASDGSLWLSLWNGFGGGYNRLDPIRKSFKWIDKPKGSFWNSDIATMSDGNLYLGCWGPGLFVLNPASGMIVKTFDLLNNTFFKPKTFVYKQQLFSGLDKIDLTGPNSRLCLPPSQTDKITPTSGIISNMKELTYYSEAFDTAGLVEYGFVPPGFIYSFNHRTLVLQHVVFSHAQPSSMAFQQGLLFIANDDGLRVLNADLSMTDLADGLVLRDRIVRLKEVHGQLFILLRNAIYRWQDGKIIQEKRLIPHNLNLLSLAGDESKNLLLAEKNRLWLLPGDGDIVRLNISNDLIDTEKLQINDVFFINGRFLTATNQGLLVAGSVSRDQKPLSVAGGDILLKGSNVTNLGQDETGTVYATTDRGLISFDLSHHMIEEFRYRTFETTPWNTLISVLAPDRFGRLWFGTSHDGYMGYYSLETKKFKHFVKKENLSGQVVGSTIQAIGADRQGRVWVGTEEAFMQLDENSGTYRVIPLWKGKSLSVSSITADFHGHLWLGSIDGLFLFDPASARVIRRFSSADGLQSNEFGPGATILPDGKIVVSGMRGINIFDPVNLPTDSVPPSPMVVRFKVDTAVILNAGDSKDLSYPYRRCDYEIEFSAMKFSNPQGASYAWMLEGYDNQWRESSNGQHEVLYSNLWPGKYRLLLKAANADGFWSEPAVKLEFVVNPPFWFTWWFVLISFGFLVFTLVALYRLRVSRLRFHQRLLERTVRERTAEIAEKNEVLQDQYEAIHVKNEEILAQRDEIEAQRDQIEIQRDEVMAQKDLISIQKKAMTDSIEYAKRIQQATLPHSELNCSAFIAGYFVFHQPRDIVSGDFYWASCRDDVFVVAVADCTGHGVPGAFMSMLGISFLNKIVNEDRVTSPDLILNLLRKNIIMALHQSGQSKEAADGMDISVVSIMKGQSKIFFAGANSQILMIKNRVPTLLKGDKMPVSFYERMVPFRLQEIDFSGGDQLYLYTDGYGDQFGGESGIKLKARYFREMLVTVAGLPFEHQGAAVDHDFFSWKRNNEQVDDVTVIGLLLG